MDIATMTREEVEQELDRLLAIRSLSTADWRRVNRLQLRLATLDTEEAA